MEHPLLDELLDAADVSDEMTAEFMDDAEAILDELGVTEEDLRGATLAELETLVRTVTMAAYRELAMDQAIAAGTAEAFVYLGPEDAVTRPFCEELVGTWLTFEEIEDLDNGTDLDVLTGCGGYNCRHQWLPLLTEEQLQDYDHGDVDAANAAAPE